MCPADANGNITSKKTYAYTREETLGTPESVNSYSYYNAVPDILINYNGQYFNYDSIGNPTSYRGMSMSWTQGRRLESLTKNGVTHSYTYDVNGIRTSKTVGDTVTNYILADGTLLGVMVPNQYRLVFLRDNNDTIYGFKYYKYVSSTDTYNYNQTYYYEFNLQGDVIALYNAAGTLTATYKYDAWGKLLGVYDNEGDAITSSTNLAIINPIRYRGYLYDTETGFYYLQSRYYDPEVGRFINADGYVSTGTDFIGYNMYAYCNNNSINKCDPSGEFPVAAAILTAVVVVGSVIFLGGDSGPEVQDHSGSSGVIMYDVPLYEQGNTNLCWAYCQLMVESYHNGVVLTQSQADEQAKQKGIEEHGEENWNNGLKNKGVHPIGTFDSIEKIYSQLEKAEGPIYAEYLGETTGHLVVITGVDLNKGLIYTNNPWGYRGQQTFEQFQNGVAAPWLVRVLSPKMTFKGLVTRYS